MLVISKNNTLISFPALQPPNTEKTQWKSTHKKPHLPLKGPVSESHRSTGCAHLVGTHDAQGTGAMFEFLCLGWSLVLGR